jgi:hypothetical protein
MSFPAIVIDDLSGCQLAVYPVTAEAAEIAEIFESSCIAYTYHLCTAVVVKYRDKAPWSPPVLLL